MTSDPPSDAPPTDDPTPASEPSARIIGADHRRKSQPHHRPSSGETGITFSTEADVMTVEEGAAFLRVGRNALYDAIGRGEVPHRRIGRTIRLSRAVLVRWLEGDDSRSTDAVRSGILCVDRAEPHRHKDSDDGIPR